MEAYSLQTGVAVSLKTCFMAEYIRNIEEFQWSKILQNH